ncbi:MAG: hypothetical protein NWF01_00020 [Candidatus Bathyarchaeota archaeon]|nr:hypothetical protein [Candidatus Bathyarchaeota archaeon]
MTGSDVRLKIATFFVIGILIGIGFTQVYYVLSESADEPLLTPTPEPSSTPTLALSQLYQNAIQDAMIANSSEVYSGLTSIVESNGNLSWTGAAGNRSVLVVTFTKYASSYPVGETVNTTWGETWVTVVPELKDFFENSPDSEENVTLRVLQLLGLPSTNANSDFVELWVSPQSLFRPTPDNEINDTTAQLAFPTSATAEYTAWFNNNIIYSYFPQRYPWTRLGYTYDWGNTTSHVGLSEFVVRQNSLVTVKSVTPLQEYLGK